MIDTLRLRIQLSISTYAQISNECVRVTRSSPNELGRRDFYNKVIMVGTHGAKIRVTLGQVDCMFIEFSAPKYWFGHNIALFDINDLPALLDDVKNVLEDTFSVTELPEPRYWRIQRLDICYTWQFATNDLAHTALMTLMSSTLPRKSQQLFDTTIRFQGTSSNSYFYLKHEEFVNNDFRELLKWGDFDFANDMKEKSNGVLRFEVSMRKQKLDSIFKQNIYPPDIQDEALLIKLLNENLDQILKLRDHSLVPLKTVHDMIFSSSTPRKGWELWTFYRQYSSTNPFDKKALSLLPRSTYYTKLKQLRALGVGLYDQETAMQFSFDIPSIYAVSNAEVA